MKKRLVSIAIAVILLLSMAMPSFASYNLYGFWASYVTTAVFSCTSGSTATNIKLAAEGCRGSTSLGAKTKSYAQCYSGQEKTCSYFNLLSTYGYCVVGGQGTDRYHAWKGYVY